VVPAVSAVCTGSECGALHAPSGVDGSLCCFLLGRVGGLTRSRRSPASPGGGQLAVMASSQAKDATARYAAGGLALAKPSSH
jgi:hypothetical protein